MIDKYKLIIIIGLPCSGKTTYAVNMYADYIYYDDFITRFVDYKLMNDIINGKKVCISDPRLCIKSTFDKYMEIFQSYVNKSDIKLILYENNPNQCLINDVFRHQTSIRTKNVNIAIIEFSKKYDPEIYKIYEIDCETINVYVNK